MVGAVDEKGNPLTNIGGWRITLDTGKDIIICTKGNVTKPFGIGILRRVPVSDLMRFATLDQTLQQQLGFTSEQVAELVDWIRANIDLVFR